MKASKNKESPNGLSHPGFDATRFMGIVKLVDHVQP
jgi:hypothetical protein